MVAPSSEFRSSGRCYRHEPLWGRSRSGQWPGLYWGDLTYGPFALLRTQDKRNRGKIPGVGLISVPPTRSYSNQEEISLLLEIDPRYVDIIVRHWESTTGTVVVLDAEGSRFGASGTPGEATERCLDGRILNR